MLLLLLPPLLLLLQAPRLQFLSLSPLEFNSISFYESPPNKRDGQLLTSSLSLFFFSLSLPFLLSPPLFAVKESFHQIRIPPTSQSFFFVKSAEEEEKSNLGESKRIIRVQSKIWNSETFVFALKISCMFGTFQVQVTYDDELNFGIGFGISGLKKWGFDE